MGYARVSTTDQNLNSQVDALKQAGCEKIFREKVSGVKTDRPQLAKLMEQARAGDTVVIFKLDRLGRSLMHLVELVSEFNERKIGLKSLNDPIDTTTAQGKLVFNIFASLAEFERDVIRERTQAGLKAARARGRTGGRPKGLTEETLKKAPAAAALYRENKATIREMAASLDMSTATFYRCLDHEGVQYGSARKS